jgi:GH15 family glucan-1,4-alpha-glucosidase
VQIEDYALVGDLQSAALIGKDGAVDWLCLPRFDSPACFAALLGAAEHGRWRIAPAGEPVAITRRYRSSSRPTSRPPRGSFGSPTSCRAVVTRPPA